MTIAKDWRKYRVGRSNSAPLESIAHVAHVPTSIRILEDKELRADLVHDESKLNKHRIRVVWLSPNNWEGAGGSRYGNVSFSFDWKSLVERKHYYWVESIAYGIPAARILITRNDWSALLERYDPTTDDGPWRFDGRTGHHHWNGDITLEILYEGNLALDLVTQIEFVGHHSYRCSIDPRNCPSLGHSMYDGCAQFLASVVARRMRVDIPGLTTVTDGITVPDPKLGGTLYHLFNSCDMVSGMKGSRITASDQAALPLARAVVGAWLNEGDEDFDNLANLFRSVDDLKRSVAAAVGESIGIENPDQVLPRRRPPRPT